MKIEDAKNKLCPFYRYDTRTQNRSYGQPGTVNHYPSNTTSTIYTRCNTTSCMMWIAQTEEEGYCGMSSGAKDMVLAEAAQIQRQK